MTPVPSIFYLLRHQERFSNSTRMLEPGFRLRRGRWESAADER